MSDVGRKDGGGSRDGQIMSECGGAQTLHQSLHRPRRRPPAVQQPLARDRIGRERQGVGKAPIVAAKTAVREWVAFAEPRL